MSNAWQTNCEDVRNVLEPHKDILNNAGILKDFDDNDGFFAQLLHTLNHARIEEAVLWGITLADQTAYAYEEIGKQLKKDGIIPRIAESQFDMQRSKT